MSSSCQNVVFLNDATYGLHSMRWRTSARARARIGACAVAAVLSLQDPSRALDWSIRSTVSERMEFDDNIGVAVDSPGNVFGSTTSLATTIAANAKTYSIIFDTDFGLNEYGGPGETRGLDSFNQSGSVALTKKTTLNAYALNLSFSHQPVSTTEFEDTGLTNVDASRLYYSADGSVTHQVNKRNSLILSARALSTDFTGTSTGLTPYFDASTSLAWKRMLTRRTDATLTGSLGYYAADNAEDTTSWIFRSKVDVSHKWTKRLTLTGGLGTNFVRTDKTTGSESSTGFSGDMGLDYRRKRTSITLRLSKALEPSSGGELQNRTSAAIGISQQINGYSAISLNASFGTQESAGSGTTSRDTVTISPLYTYRPAQNWQTSLGYTYRYSKASESAQSHKVFMTVSRSFAPLP